MPEAPVRVWGSRPLACRELMPTSSDGRFGHARGFGHRASAPVSKSVGFSRCPQAPSAFIKLIVQGAIFGSNYLDCIIILHAQNLSDQTSAVNKNDRLFIYTSRSPDYPNALGAAISEVLAHRSPDRPQFHYGSRRPLTSRSDALSSR